jgi:hypothetical protein
MGSCMPKQLAQHMWHQDGMSPVYSHVHVVAVLAAVPSLAADAGMQHGSIRHHDDLNWFYLQGCQQPPSSGLICCRPWQGSWWQLIRRTTTHHRSCGDRSSCGASYS